MNGLNRSRLLNETKGYGLSQLGIFLDTQTLKKHPSGHPKDFYGEIYFNVNLKHIIDFFPFNSDDMPMRISCLILINIYMFMVEI